MAVKKKVASAKPAAKPAKARRATPASEPVAELADVMEVAPVVEAVAPVTVVEAAPVMEVAPVLEAANAAEPAAVAEPKTAVPRKGKARYLLPANMEIAALGPVHADLVALEASNDGPFIIDGAQLSVIDTAGLQLLISFVSAVNAAGKKVSWDNYSIQAYQLANELGVVEQLGD